MTNQQQKFIKSERIIKTHFNFTKLFNEMLSMKFFNGYIKENNDNYDLIEVEFFDELELLNSTALAHNVAYRNRHITQNNITKQSFHFGGLI